MNIGSANPQQGNSLRQSLAFSAAGNLGARSISLLGFFILARQLSPTEFGLMTMVAVFTDVADLFMTMGMDAAIIQNPRAAESHYSTAFWCNTIIGGISTAVFYILAVAIAGIYGVNELVPLIQTISFLFLLNSLIVVPIAVLKKRLQFRSIAAIEVVANLVGFSLAIYLAFQGWGVWALVVNQFANATIDAILAFILAKWRPRLLFSRNEFVELWKVGGYLMGTNLVTYIIDKVDYFMIGSLIGAKTLGAYKLAFQIATLPRQVFYGILNRVLFPFYSAFLANGNKDRIIAVHKQLMRMFAFFAVPLFIGLATIADHFVLSVLGKKWEEMIPMLGLLLINFMVTLLSDFNSAIYLSSGRTKLQFYLSIFLRLDIILFIVVGIYIGGVQGLLIGFLLAKIINFFPFTYFASRIMGYTIWDIMRNFTPMFLSGFFMFIVLQMGKWLIFTHPGNVLELVGLVAMGALSYLAALAIFRKEIFEEVFRLVWSTRRAVEADGG